MTGNAKETDGVDRRTALRLMAATLACTTTACERPADTIVPYVRMPERVTPGQPLYFATALGVGGYAAPVVVKSDTGRPIKVEGNPDHPACRGATDAFAQCEILALYDPGRSRAVQRRGQITAWGKLQAELTAHRQRWSATQGEGLRLLTGATTSPFLAARISALLARFPKARWHRWEPINADNTRAGCELAFGERLDPLLHLDKARVIVALDDDLIGPGPRQVRHALALTSGRRPRAGTARLTRLYAIEPVPSLTGAAADHRLPLRRSRVTALAVALARACGAELPAQPEHGDVPLDKAAHAFVAAVADDLKRSAGAALVTVGEAQPPEVHALGHWINEYLGAFGQTIELMRPIEADAVDHVSSLTGLSRDMAAGDVDTLAILDSNPVYTAPSDLDFSEALARVPLSLRLGLYDDETSALTTWHIPAVHALEAWGDRATTDGAISLVQPLIAPLYGGMTSHDILDALDGAAGEPGDSYEALQAFWRKRSNTADFDAWWHRTLDSGVVDGTASVSVPPPRSARLPAIPAQAQPVQHEIVFLADPSVLDGSYAENAWAQETPRPMTKLVWGNAAHISPADAKWLSISDGDIVRLRAAGRSIEIPVVIAAGTADGSIGLHLGYGRRTGVIAKGVGTDVYPLRTSEALWTVGVTVMAAGRRSELLTTQAQTRIEGRNLLRTTALSEVASAALRTADGAPPASLYTEHPATNVSPYQWAMVIDTHGSASAATPASSPARPRTTCRSSARRRSRAGATCTGCASTPMTTARPDSRSRASSRCPACIARRRPASRSARSRPRCTTARG